MTLNLLSRPLSDSQFRAGKEPHGTNLLKDINNLDYIKTWLSPSFRQHALFTGTLQKPDPPVRVHLWPSYSQIICQISQDTKKRRRAWSDLGLTVLLGRDSGSPCWAIWSQKHRFCKGQLSLSSLRERAERCQKWHTTEETVQSESDAQKHTHTIMIDQELTNYS